MNRLQYRIVFNKQRGQLMAVAETATSQVKGGSSGQSAGPSARRLASAASTPTPSRGPPTMLALAAALALGAMITLTPDVQAQVKADPNAPKNQQPTVVNSANGTVQVNIQTPSAAGVSRNTYSQFDVDSRGVILNNARSDASTQLGGFVQANPWLAKGSARVILNEVNSNAPSQLRGFVEVAGQRAEVVIANPSGIQVDGAGFINASAAVLTTGTPRFNADGSIGGYGVQGGLIRIDGQGLDASQTDYTALLARAVEINAGLWAKDLRVQTGTQVMSVDETGVSTGETLSPAGERPRYGLDSTALGGIYAQRITLVGTEAGLGVRQAGQVVGGQLTLRADGWLENTGAVYAQQPDANGAAALTVASATGVRNAGWLASRGSATLQAPQLQGDAGSVTAAGMASDGSIVAGSGSLSLSASQSINQSGQLLAADRLSVQAPAVALSAAQAQAGAIALSGDQVAAQDALLIASGTVEATGSLAVDFTRAQVQAGALQATAPSLLADGAQLSATGALRLSADGRLSTRGASLAGGQLAVTAQDLDLRQAEWLQIGTDALSVRVAGALTADAARIASNGASMTLVADAFSARGASLEQYGTGALHLDGRTLDLSGATLWSNGALWTRGAQVTLDGAAVQARSIEVASSGLLSQQRATLRTTGMATLTGDSLDLRDGRVFADGGLSIQAAQALRTDRGELQAATGALTITGQADITNVAGTLVARDGVSVQARSLTQSQGAALSGQSVTLTLQGELRQDASASIAASERLDVLAQSVHSDGQLRAGAQLGVTAQQGAALAGTVYGGNVTVSTGQDLSVDGLLAAQGQLSVTAQRMQTSAASTVAAGLGSDGRVSAAGGLTMSAGSDLIARGQVLAGDLRLTAAQLDLAGAQLQAVNTMSLGTPGALITEGARMSAGSLSLQAQDWRHAGGQLTVSGAGDLLVSLAGQLDNRQGLIQTNARALTLAAQSIDNRGGQIIASGDALSLRAESMINQSGTVTTAGDLSIESARVENRDGELSGRQVSVVARQIDNAGGGLMAATRDLTLRGDSVTNAGTLQAQGELSISSGLAIDNSGLIRAGGAARLETDRLTHTGTIAAALDVAVRAGEINSSGTFAAGLKADNSVGQSGELTLSAQRTLVQTGTTLAGGSVRIEGADLQLQGSSTQASQVTAQSRTGELRLDRATMVANGLLDLQSATTLVTEQGHLSGGSVAIVAADWRHAGGELGQTDATGRFSAVVRGTLDNDGGRLVGNGSSLSLNAQRVENQAGQIIHAGGLAGELRLDAQTLLGAGGTIGGAGAVTLSVTGLADLSGAAALTQADRLSLSAGQLVTREATLIAHQSAQLSVSGEFDHSSGLLQSGGLLSVSAGALANRQGQIGGVQVSLSGGSVDNGAQGLIAAQQGLSIDVAQLANAGSLQAGEDLDLRVAGRLDNAGLIRASGQAQVSADALANTGTIAAQRALSIQAGSVDSSGALAAGLRDDNSLAASGDLTITTTGRLRQSGTTLAGGAMTLSGEELALQGGQFQSRQTTLDARGGTLRLDGATLSGGERLTLQTTGALDTSSANLSADSVSIQAGSWRNQAGQIAQLATTGTLAVSVAGTLDNQHGSIAGNATDLILSAGLLDNRAGSIIHAGSTGGQLALTVGRLEGAGGELLSKGALVLQATESVTLDGAQTQARRIELSADSLSHRGGQLVSETGATLTLHGALDNTGGVVQTTDDLRIDAGAIENTGGQIGGRTVTLSTTGALINGAQGLIAASQALTIDAGRLDNAGSLQSQAAMDLTVQGAMTNSGTAYARGPLTIRAGGLLSTTGMLASQGSLTVQAAEIASTGGLIAGLKSDNTLGTQGDLTLTTTGALQQSGQTLAAGALSVQGGSLQLQNATLQGQSVGLTSTVGDLLLQRATVATSGALTLQSAGALDSSAATLSGDTLAIRAQRWANRDGSVTQTGANGSLSATLSGTLDNTGGEIAAAGRTLTLSAGTIDNTQGRLVHAGAEGLRLKAGSLTGAGGEILGAQAVTLAVTGAVDLSQAKTQGSQVTIDAASLRHQGGQLLSGSDVQLRVTGTLDNTGGTVVATRDLLAQAGTLDNTGGQLGGRAVDLTAGHLINGAQGLINAQAALTVDAQQLSNAGTLQSGGDTRLTVTGDMTHSGGVYAQGSAVLSVGQSLANTGAIGAQGGLTIDAGALSGSGSLAAGLRPDNSLATTGDLIVRTSGTLQASGAIASAGALTLSGRELQLQDSRLQAAAASLTATGGTLRLDRAVLASAGSLMLNSLGALVTDGATLSGTQVGLSASDWRHVGGSLAQIGSAGQLIATVSGQIVNTDGRIQSGGTLLQLQAQSIDNTRGAVVQAGSGPLSVSTGSFSGASGQLLSNGMLSLAATGAVTLANAQTQGSQITVTGSSLDHRGGNLVSSGTAVLRVDGAVDNSAGTMASGGALELRSAAFTNGANGLVQSDSTLLMTVGGLLDNQGGRLRSGAAMTLNAGSVDNRSGWVGSDGALTVTSGVQLLNGNGQLLAQQAVTLDAASIGNQGGRIASLQGNVTVRSQGLLDNAQGAMQAAQTVDLTSTAMSNRQGEVSGTVVGINTRGQTLDNTGGRLLAAQSLTTDSATLENRGGLLQSGGSLSVQTHGAALNNTRDASVTTPTGLIASGAMTISAGTLTNESGMSAGGTAQVTVGQLTNRAELSAADLGLSVSGLLDNQGGRLIGGQSFTGSAQQVLNQGGLIYGGNSLTLTAAGRIDNTGSGGTGQGIQGGQVLLQAQQLDNVGGQVLASGNLGLTITQALDNSNGALGAAGAQSIGDGGTASALSLNNSGGRIWSGSTMGLNLRELAGGVGGQITSGGGLSVKLAGDFSYGAGSQFQSTGDMTLTVAGNFSNQGTLRSGGGLSILAANIDNAASGELSGSLTVLTAAGQLTNRGLIDGDGVMLTADRLVNLGSGRLYGGDIVIDGGQLVNGAEGGVSAVIAARRSIDAQMTRDIANTGGALIFADGVLTMTGASLLNENATIEASSGLGLQMSGAIINRTVLNGVATGQVGSGGSGGTGGVTTPGDNHGNQQTRMAAMRAPITDQPIGDDGTGGGDPSGSTVGGVTFLDTKAFIRSGGSMSLVAGSLLNSGATIEARGDLLLQASTIDNLNPYLAWTVNPNAGAPTSLRIDYSPTSGPYEEYSVDIALNGKTSDQALTEWKEKHRNMKVVRSVVTGGGDPATVTQSLAANIIVGGQLTVVGATSITNDMSRVVGTTGVAISGGKVNNVAHTVNVVDAQGVSRPATLTLPSQAQSFIPAAQGAGGRAQAGGVSTGGGANAQSAAASGRANAATGGGLSGFFQRAVKAVDAGNAAQAGLHGGAQWRNGGGLIAAAVEAGAGAGSVNSADVQTRDVSSSGFRAIGDTQAAVATGEVQGSAQTGRLSIAQALRAAAAAQAEGSVQGTAKAMTQASKALASSASAQRPDAAQGVTLRGSGATFNGKPLALSVRVNLTPPSNSLFKTHKEPTSKVLIETDPRFANYREWLSSDYLLQAMALDPATTQKRLGDGFYEQRLVREQIGQLTGTGYLSGYADDETQYRALLSNGATFAKEHQLVPGVALTAEQMSQLTSDLVWLVEQTVTLADGSTQRVLVPQVYLVPRDGDLLPSGSLIAGGRVEMALSGDFTNGGSVRGGEIGISAQNITNTGDLRGTTLALSAQNDLRNVGGALAASGDMTLTAGRDIVMQSTTASGGTQRGNVTTTATVLDQVASLTAGGVMVVQAGRDVTLQAINITQGGADGAGADGGVLINAGRDLSLTTVQTASSRDEVKNASNYKKESQRQDVGTVVQAEGEILLKAGQDITATAAQIASAQSVVTLDAARDVSLLAGEANAVMEEMTQKTKKSLFKKKITTTYNKTDQTLAIGTSLSGDAVTVMSGQDIRTEGADIKASGLALLDAKRDLLLDDAIQTQSTTQFSQTVKKASGLGKIAGAALMVTGAPVDMLLGSVLLTGQSGTNNATKTVNEAVGTSVSAGNVVARAGRDATLQGATVVADSDVFIAAGRNLTISTAENTESGGSSSSSKKSGFIGSWWQPAVGTVKMSSTSAQQGTSQTGSQVASLGGDVTLRAGELYTQTGSSVVAQAAPSGLGGNVDIEARKVVIEAAENLSDSSQTSKFSKTALGGSVSIPVVSAIQSAVGAVQAGHKTEDPRMQSLAALNATLAGMDAYKAGQELIAGGTTGIKVGVSLGTSKSQSASTEQSTTVVGSQIAGQGDVSIRATGDGAGSTLQVVGSDIKAGGTTTLKADGAIDLEAARNHQVLHSANSSSGASIGISYSMGGTQNGFSLELSANRGKGKADGQGNSAVQTHVSGDQVRIESGGDTTLKGAVVQAGQVSASVGGNLNIESLQDSATYAAKQQSASVGVSLCIPPFCYGMSTASGSISNAQAKGNYNSVTEQSGIAAGDGGFQLNVKGNTDLKGGLIASTQQAIDDKKNSLSTGSLTYSDIQNSDAYKASGYSVGVSLSTKMGDQPSPKTPEQKQGDGKSSTKPGFTPGVGSVNGSQTSTTASGISGAEITITDEAKQQQLTGQDAASAVAGVKRDVTSDKDNSGALKKAWDGQSLMNEVQTQMQITQQALPRIADEIGTRMGEKAIELRAQGKESEAEKYEEGGVYRVAAHAALGALGGGLAGGVGAGASAAAIPTIKEVVSGLGLPEDAKQLVIAATDTAIGAAVGGSTGAIAAGNQVVNNYLSHQQWDALAKEKAACKGDAKCEKEVVTKYVQISKVQDAALAMCDFLKNCDTLRKEVQEGREEQIALIQRHELSDNFAGAADLQSVGERLAASAKYRQDVSQAVVAKFICDTDPTRCNVEAAKRVGFLLGGVAAGAYATTLVAAAPAMALAARMSVQSCVANPVLCMNQAGIIAGDIAMGEALGGASLAGGTLAAGKVVGKATADEMKLVAKNAAAAVEEVAEAAKAAQAAQAAAAAANAAKPKMSIDDLIGATFDPIELSHLAGRQDGRLGEQIALQVLNEKTGLNLKPLQNASNHGCDGCAVSIQGDTVTVIVVDAKSSQYGVDAAKSATGDPAVKLRRWLDTPNIANASPESAALVRRISEALSDGATVKGLTVKVGVPAPGTTGTVTMKVEPWTKN